MTFDEIQQAIRQLSRLDRERLAQWFLNVADFGDRVAETASAYEMTGGGRPLSVDEYLTAEEGSLVRHEYLAGEIFAMSGATMRHTVIADELLRVFNNHLDGSACRAFSAGMTLEQIYRGAR